MELTHLGHACVLAETPRARLLIDPGTLSSRWHGLEDVDAVLVTHRHADHVDVPGVRRLLATSPQAQLVVDEVTATLFPGVECTVAHPGDHLRCAGENVTVLGGVHAPVHGDVPGCPNLAFLLGDGDLFHPGDSLELPPGPVDTLAVPIAGPWLRLGQAVDYALTVAPRTLLPIHEGELTNPGKYVAMLHELVGGSSPALAPTAGSHP